MRKARNGSTVVEGLTMTPDEIARRARSIGHAFGGSPLLKNQLADAIAALCAEVCAEAYTQGYAAGKLATLARLATLAQHATPPS